MKASIDQLVDKLERQVTRYREKRRRGRSRDNGAVPVEENPGASDDSEPEIVKTKQFPVKPMSPEEAVLQLELVGHDFFVFRNGESGEVNVVYKRRDGGYGLIEPST
jgi:putative sigma-54 modulation protein